MGDPWVFIVGGGLVGFGLAMLAILSSSAERSIERQMVQVRAMEMRNEYIRTVLTLRGARTGQRPSAPRAPGGPVGNVGPETDAGARSAA